MRETVEGHRAELLVGLRRFVAAACHVPGVRRIAPVGSIVTAKPDPKDVDVLIVVSDAADLAPLAAQARRLQGHAQVLSRGADVFLANERGACISSPTATGSVGRSKVPCRVRVTRFARDDADAWTPLTSLESTWSSGLDLHSRRWWRRCPMHVDL